jgi:flagellar export protein FliJ
VSAVFRLGRMLRLRTQLRQLRQLEVEAIVADLAALEREARVHALARERVADEEAQVAREGRLSPALLVLMRAHAAALADLEQRATRRAAETRAILETKRAELVEERREERKLERLGQRHRERVIVEEARLATNLLDELAIQAHGRVRREGEHGET